MFSGIELSPELRDLILFSLVKIAVAIGVIMFMISYTVMAERWICAAIQGRLGPNRVGPWGVLQPIADGVKSFLKEDFVPGHVRKVYFWLAPGLAMLPGLLTVAVIPFGSNLGQQKMVIADLNIGILYTFGIVSLGVYSIVIAGYAANSKYPFLGGIRSSSQLISYEVAMAMAVIPVFMLVGDLNLSRVIEYQTSGWFGWLIFKAPLSCVLFIIAGFAETNRLPFDLPEAENELVGGYNTEYSSIKFALFFMGEYANMILVSAMTVTLFLGGWTLPFFGLNEPAQTLGVGVLHILVFLAKLAFMVAVMIWVRWMLPRFRFDQLMDLGWRRMMPLALANIVLYAVVLWMRA
jgi:NADH-quinone oxidoreductase subunit H